MAGLWGVLFAGVLALSGAVPVRAQFASNGSSSSLQTAAGATASARAATTADMPTGAGAADLVNESVVVLPCIPVAAYWTGQPQSDGMPPGPDLAIVSTKVRPKNARVHLDGRFAGRARYLDGKPGYLYLEPGFYRLEIRFDGYRTVVVELDVAWSGSKARPRKARATITARESHLIESSPHCRRTKRFWHRRRGTVPIRASDGTSRLVPVKRGTPKGKWGPHCSLKMENPLAMTPGAHLIEVEAPGFIGAARTIVLENGETLELVITLSRAEKD